MRSGLSTRRGSHTIQVHIEASQVFQDPGYHSLCRWVGGGGGSHDIHVHIDSRIFQDHVPYDIDNIGGWIKYVSSQHAVSNPIPGGRNPAHA